MWTCKECIEVAQLVYGVPEMERAAHDAEARDNAGEKAGAYLEKIGKSDLATLTQEEWRAFLDTFRREWSSQMRRLGASCAPPF